MSERVTVTPEQMREDIEKALRGQGILTEPLVQWLAGICLMVHDVRGRVTEIEQHPALSIPPLGSPVVEIIEPATERAGEEG
jgi:hypothetical protein